jgi:hypothetical protein
MLLVVRGTVLLCTVREGKFPVFPGGIITPKKDTQRQLKSIGPDLLLLESLFDSNIYRPKCQFAGMN